MGSLLKRSSTSEIVFWTTPVITRARLVFEVDAAAYILLAIQFKERDVFTGHGAAYENYRRQVPILLAPVKKEQSK
jgi:protein-S-isoprenylcysteine O-methyltransferase Ste14